MKTHLINLWKRILKLVRITILLSPFYVIDDSIGISGAQPPEVIVDAINQSKNNN